MYKRIKFDNCPICNKLLIRKPSGRDWTIKKCPDPNSCAYNVVVSNYDIEEEYQIKEYYITTFLEVEKGEIIKDSFELKIRHKSTMVYEGKNTEHFYLKSIEEIENFLILK